MCVRIFLKRSVIVSDAIFGIVKLAPALVLDLVSRTSIAFVLGFLIWESSGFVSLIKRLTFGTPSSLGNLLKKTERKLCIAGFL